MGYANTGNIRILKTTVRLAAYLTQIQGEVASPARSRSGGVGGAAREQLPWQFCPT